MYYNKKYITTLLKFAAFIISIIAAIIYPGTFAYYFIFSSLSFILLFFAFAEKQKCLTPKFLAFFLWMGLWLKSFIYFASGRKFNEAIGQFNLNNFAAWDRVFITISLALLGFILSVYITNIYRNKISLSPFVNKLKKISSNNDRYSNTVPYQKTIAIVLFLITFAITYINYKWQIHQIGLTPQKILPWPTNALIAFYLNIGLAIILSQLIDSNFKTFNTQKNHVPQYLAFYIFTLFIASLSTLSRSIFIFQSAPLILTYFIKSDFFHLNKKKFLIYTITSITLLFTIISSTNIIRSKKYLNSASQITSERQKLLIRLEVLNGGIKHVEELIKSDPHHIGYLATLEKERKDINEKLSKKNYTQVVITETDSNTQIDLKKLMSDFISPTSFKSALNLISYRFVGLEGSLAVDAYPEKNINLFLNNLLEKRNLNKPSIYQEISNSSYKFIDTDNWQFATLPGIIAFLYLTGSLFFVFIGSLLTGVLVNIYEILIFKLSFKNVFLTSLISCYMSNVIAQFGISPRNEFFYMTIIFIFVLLTTIVRFYIYPKK